MPKKGYKQTDKHKKAISKGLLRSDKKPGAPSYGENNSAWRGDKVGYRAIHDYIVRSLGKPSKCNHCKATDKKRYEWSCDGEYTRDLNKWERLCVACHRKKDGWLEKMLKTRKLNRGY